MIIVPEIVFLVTSRKHCWGQPWKIVISCVFFILCIFLLLKLALSDPGFILNTSGLQTIGKPSQDDRVRSSFFHAKFVHLTSYGRLQRMKYCKTCYILRPPRSSHCPICGCCVEKYDHHCPWLGNCIGKKNYKNFLLFLLSTCALICFDFGVSMDILKSESSDYGMDQALKDYGGILFVVIYSGIVKPI